MKRPEARTDPSGRFRSRAKKNASMGRSSGLTASITTVGTILEPLRTDLNSTPRGAKRPISSDTRPEAERFPAIASFTVLCIWRASSDWSRSAASQLLRPPSKASRGEAPASLPLSDSASEQAASTSREVIVALPATTGGREGSKRLFTGSAIGALANIENTPAARAGSTLAEAPTARAPATHWATKAWRSPASGNPVLPHPASRRPASAVAARGRAQRIIGRR